MSVCNTEESLLQSAFDLLKHDWVKSFLFPTDRTTYVRQLHHALSQQTAITAQVHYGTLSSPVGPCQSLPGLDKQLSLLCVPSFSTGKISVGFEITECLTDATPRPLGVQRFISRCVRDDDEGLMLIIAEHPDLGVTELTCCTLLSPGCRSHVHAVINYRKLRSFVSDLGRGKKYDPLAIREATSFAYSSVDMRTCPICGCNSWKLCSCRPELKQKAHPLDHDVEYQNMHTYTGDFGGCATIKVVKDEEDVVAKFVSTLEAIFTCDREKQRKLSAWAMTHAFSTEPVRLENYSMPRERLLIEAGEGSVVTTVGEDSSSSRNVLAHVVRQSQKRKHSDNEKELSVRRRIRRTSMSDGEPQDALFANSKAFPEQTSPCTPVQECRDSIKCNDQIKISLATNAMPVETAGVLPVSNVAKPPLPSSATQIALQKSVDTGVIASNPVSNVQTLTAEQSTVQQAGIGAQQVQGPLPNGVVLVPVQPVYQAVMPVAPGMRLAPASGASVAMGIRAYHDTRTKDEIRKARNRASAQRSNEKKKREVAKLQEDLEEFVKRKEALVERERALRLENAELKAVLGNCSVV